MISLLLKILVAIAPAVVIAIIMVNKDPKPEPKKWLWIATVSGVLIGPCIFIMAICGYPVIEADSYLSAFMTSFISAAIPEESLKFVVLYLIAKKCRYFDEMFDGIVYAVCIGMGFAGFENILYITGEDEGWLFVGISRALLSVPMHYFFAVIMGTFFSLGWFDDSNRLRNLTLALIIPLVIHGLYDTLCFSIGLNEDVSLVILIVFLIGFKYIRRYVKHSINTMLQLDSYKPDN